MNYLFVVLLWIGYCALHSFLISIRFTNFMNRILKRYYAFFRLFYIMISIALLVPLIQYTGQVETATVFTNAYPFSLVRQILSTGSLLLFFWAFFFDYDSLSFFGIRQIMNFGKTASPSPTGLKRRGLLGITRHPMYLALIIYLWCQTFRVMDIVINTILTLYVIIGTVLEERKLLLEFGDSYKQYQREVPMLIPFTKI
jgi:protein-S-isoprenylcysteine O-methyltransferase Ste14